MRALQGAGAARSSGSTRSRAIRATSRPPARMRAALPFIDRLRVRARPRVARAARARPGGVDHGAGDLELVRRQSVPRGGVERSSPIPSASRAACPAPRSPSQVDERTYAGTITVKVGPVSATLQGHGAVRTARPGGPDGRNRGHRPGHARQGRRRHAHDQPLVERAPGETEVTVTSQVNVIGHPGAVRPRDDPGCQRPDVRHVRRGDASGARDRPETSTEPDAGLVRRHAAQHCTERSCASASAEHGSREPLGRSAPPVEVLSFGSAVVGRAACAGRCASPAVLDWNALLLLVFLWCWLG